MTFRRDTSDLGVIVRHPQERHADAGLRHLTDSGMGTMPSSRPTATVPTFSRDDVSFGSSVRRAPVLAAEPQSTSAESTATSSGQPDVILVKSGFKQVATRVREILYVEAARNYVRIHLENGQILKSRVQIDRLATHLGSARFLRIHRGCLVNVDRIRAVTALLGGRLLLTLSDGSKVTVARDRRRFVLGEIGAPTAPRA